jgi:hypothetical protein
MMIRVRVEMLPEGETSDVKKSINLGCKHEIFCLLYCVILKDVMFQLPSSCVREKQMLNFKNEMYM